MANIRDVARLANVSPATVSRILNDNQIYKTTDETRERVLRAVTELGYQAPVKKRPRPDQSDTSGFSVGVLLATTKGKYSDPYYLAILSGIEDELARLGGTVSVIQTEQELEDQAILNRLLGAGLSGLIMMRPLSEPLFEQLHSLIPHIVGIDTGHMPIDNVEYDHLRVSKMAVEYLYSKGHRSIGYIGGSVGGAPLKRSRRYRSYLETMADLGLEVRSEWVLNCDWDDRKCISLVEKTYHEHSLPTAFYAASDLMAMAALRALYQLGIRVPDQVAVIGMSNIEMSQYANPPLTTIDVPAVEMGITAARIIASRVRGDTTLPKRVLLPSRLIERDSV
jgi:DNA-binding LacI/PurR family transcriptional regulator